MKQQQKKCDGPVRCVCEERRASEEHVTVETQVGIDGHAKRLELRCNLQSASGNVEMSRPTSAVIILASAAAYTIFMTCSNAVSVECPRRYADCSRD